MFDPDFETQHDHSEQTSRSLRTLLLAAAALWALVGVACTASAQTTNGTVQGAAEAAAGSASRSGAAIYQNFEGTPGQQGVTYSGGMNDRYRATIRNTPDALAPSVNGGVNPCMGAASGSNSLPGFGLSLGFSWSEDECERRQLASLTFNMGDQEAAREVLCATRTYREARARAGQPCQQDRPAGAPPSPPAAIPVAAVAPYQVQPQAQARAPRPDWCATASPAERRRHAQVCG